MSASGGMKHLSDTFTVPTTVVRQQIGSKGTSVSQQANYKLLKCLSPFRQSSEMYFQCSMWSLFLCSCFTSEPNVREQLAKTEKSLLSASPPGFRLDVFVITPLLVTSTPVALCPAS